jgi:hypothetical protein
MECQLRKVELTERPVVDQSAENVAKVQITSAINSRVIQVQKCALNLMEFPNDHQLKNVTSKY